jgi:modulator of FtsH protease HflC
MNKIIIPIIGLLAIFLLFSSVYTLNEVEQAIVLQFGEPVNDKAITEPGLHFKVPFIQDVTKFEKRLMEWDGAANEIPTKDNKYVFIDTFARWRIVDALQFYKSAKNEYLAQSRLDDIIDGVVRDEITNRVMAEIIRSTDRVIEVNESESNVGSIESKIDLAGARLEIVKNIQANVGSKLAELKLGIEVTDVQIKRINYNKQVQSKLFNRMISKQNQIAERYRAQGQGTKLEISGEQIEKKNEILSKAYLESQKIRGAADAKATKIYADAYGQNRDFYNFIKTLETYEMTLDSTTKVILSTDNPYLKYIGK